MTPAMARAAPLYKQKPPEDDREEDAEDRGKVDAAASGGAGEDKSAGGGSMWDVVSKGVSSAAESAKIGAEKTKLRAEVLYAENRLAAMKREFGEPCYELLAKDDDAALRVRFDARALDARDIFSQYVTSVRHVTGLANCMSAPRERARAGSRRSPHQSGLHVAICGAAGKTPRREGPIRA